ncbi:MAG: nuclear transport factor 2 family protein [Pseudomonadota bacterium]
MNIREQIQECYAAYAARDLEGTMKPFADNVCFEWTADSKHSKFSGCSNGREKMIERLAILAEQFEFLEVKLLDLIVEGNKAAARIEMKLKSNQTGEEFTNHSGHFWQFEDGVCTEFAEYYDTALVGAHVN